MFRIGDLELQRLSGPVSFRYLVPKKEAFQEKAREGVVLPIIILLGDLHFSEEDRCDPCDEEKGCYTIESKTLLKQFDSIGERVPVDFYTEYHNQKTSYDNQEGVLFRKFHKETILCHDVEHRGTPIYQCDYPNVRWHYADSRFWTLSDKFESYYRRVTDYLHSLTDLSTPKPIEVVVSVDKIQTDEAYMLHQLVTLLQKAFAHHWSLDQLALSWSKVFANKIIQNPRSLIYKQLMKAAFNLNIEMYCYISLTNTFKKWRISSVNHLLFPQNKPSLDSLTQLIQYMFQGKPIRNPSQHHLRLLNILKELVEWFNSPALDLYMIGRMFKPPKDNITSYLTLGFLGDAHSSNIGFFLAFYLNWYEIKFIASNVSRRCLSFDYRGVNFNDDLEQYIAMRQPYESVEPHLTKLAQESQARHSTLDPNRFRELSYARGRENLSLTKAEIGSLIDTRVEYTPEAILLLNDMMRALVANLVSPSSDGEKLTLSQLLQTIASYPNSLFQSYARDEIKALKEDDMTSKLNLLLVKGLIHQYVGSHVEIERAVIDLIEMLIHSELVNILGRLVYEEKIDVVQKKDILKLFEEEPDFNRPPFGF